MNDSICRHLRTKKMFIPAQADEALKEQTEPGASCHFWCNRTLTEVGWDDQPVHKDRCGGWRSCFEE